MEYNFFLSKRLERKTTKCPITFHSYWTKTQNRCNREITTANGKYLFYRKNNKV